MDIRNLTPNVSISGQLQPDDVEPIKAMGFKAIVCNRPDREAAGQPLWSEIEAAAAAHGLATAFIPVTPGTIEDDDARRFRDVVTAMDKPVLAFCGTGKRAAQMWALAARDRLTSDEVIRMAARAGCDLEAMRDRLDSAI